MAAPVPRGVDWRMAVKRAVLSLLAIVALGAAAYWFAGRSGDSAPPAAYQAPGLEPLTAQAAAVEAFRLTPALLMVVYDGFAKTSEEDVYDTLAEAADGAALEALYLERAGAMVGGGLTEADQTIHEMRMKALTSRLNGEALTMDAAWEVIGTVGHAEHLHVRGNTYRARLTVAPVNGAWKITDFDLLDVDRDAAGAMVKANGT